MPAAHGERCGGGGARSRFEPGLSLVEVNLANKGEALRLQLEAESYGVEFNDHYLRQNSNGSVTATVFADEQGLDRLDAAGYEIGATIEGPNTWERRIDQRQVEVRQERRAGSAALDDPVTITSHEDEIVVLRVDYFENYAGRFLSVEAKDRLGGSTPTGQRTRDRRFRCPGTAVRARASTPRRG
jgi:hypothetical protein